MLTIRHRAGPVLFASIALLVPALAGAPRAAAQERRVLAIRQGPQFLFAASTWATPVRVEPRSAPALRRKITVRLDDAPLEEALAFISRASGLRFFYSKDVLPLDTRVHLRAEAITIAAALTQVLFGLGIDVLLGANDQVALVMRPAARPAQLGAVTGRVSDLNTGAPLAGAAVLLEATSHGGITNDSGQYHIAGVPAGEYTIAVRRLGYARASRPVSVPANGSVTVDFVLDVLPAALAEIVVTATGEQRRLELGHVVTKVRADSLIREAPVSTVSDLLSARIPGLQVLQVDGTVGGGARLRIRGANTIEGSAEPIVIVDGVRYDTDVGVVGGPFAVPSSSRLNDLNVNDIESVEVVKGPSATTLYGTDAANGVIVITTRRGRPGPARWHAYLEHTSTALPVTDFPNNYWAWGRTLPADQPTNCTLGSLAAGACVRDSITTFNPLNSPEYDMFRKRPRWQFGTGVSGGTEGFGYYFSADFERAVGPLHMPPAEEERLERERGVSSLPEEQLDPNALTKANLRANITARLGEGREIQIRTGYIQSETRMPSFFRLSPYEGAFQGSPEEPYPSRFRPGDAFSTTSTEEVSRFLGSTVGKWRATSWLDARATIGLDLTHSTRHSLAARDASAVAIAGLVGDDRTSRAAKTIKLGAMASFRRGRLSTRTAVGAQYVHSLVDGLIAQRADLTPGGSSFQHAGGTPTVRQSYSERATLGSYVEQTFGLNDRLFLTGALRADGASSFGTGYQAAIYPKANVSWLASEEPFFPRPRWLDELRLRYAFGVSGVQPGATSALPQLSVLSGFVDGAVRSATRLNLLRNPELRPERVREHEFGFDLLALEGRIRIEATRYVRRATDVIVFAKTPEAIPRFLVNLGAVRNEGYEGLIKARLLDGDFASLDVTVHASSNENEVLDMGDVDPSHRALGGTVEGYPLGARFYWPLDSYSDENGDGIIEESEIQMSDSAAYGGRSTPPRQQALSAVLGLFNGRVRISALVNRSAGFSQYNSLRGTQCRLGLCRAVVDPDAPLAEQAEAMALRTGVGPHGTRFDFIETGDFTRFRELSIAYDLPPRLMGAVGAERATLSLQGRNLALWSSFSFPDPESRGYYDGAISSANSIPQSRSWTLRMDVGF